MENIDGLYLWSFDMFHGMTSSTLYVVTTERDLIAAATKAEAIRNDPDRFITRECIIRNVQFLGMIDEPK
jgi:hypothetical protein